MTFDAISQIIAEKLGETVEMDSAAIQPFISIKAEMLTELAKLLKDYPRFYFDFLACITAIDNGPEANTMEVVYNFDSIALGHSLMVKTLLPRENPKVPSLSHLWHTADWHEREQYDLLGIVFTGHPDLRRILLPDDWKGHPLRKDYQEQETYHGIRVAYGDRDDPGATNPERR